MASLKRFSALGSSAASPATDPQFNLTTLLLHGDGTNGAQNNTFLDSSSNNFTITRNGNTTQGTFTPFSQTGWSNHFDGDTDRLNVGGNIGDFTGDFTVECWVYFNASGQINKNFYLGRPSSSGTGGASFGTFSTADRLQFGASGIAYDVSSTNTIPINQWVHVAAVRNGSNLSLYINGVNDGSVTQTRTYINDIPSVGGNAASAAQTFNGYISNLRVVRGTAVYTANFTPPTSQLTAITNTSLLTCQSNRFIDNSSNNFTITSPAGTPSVQAFSPFAPNSAYSTSVVGGSGYFDGTGDFLSVSSANASATGDFTIEGWIYFNSTSTQNTIFQIGTETVGRWAGIITPNGVIAYDIFAVGQTTLGGTFQRFSWNHVAFVRSGSTITGYINGVSAGTGTRSGTIGNANGLYIWGTNTTARAVSGYLAGFRYVNGTAVYTSNFTPPTAPPTTITNTQLLTNFTNAGIIDNTAKNDLETFGNAQISTSVKKFGTGSLAFDGAGDYLRTTSSASESAFGSGNFTVELWLYINVGSTTYNVIDYRPTSVNGAYLLFYLNAGVPTVLVNTSNRITGSAAFPVATWTHVAVCRSGTSTRMFIDGVQSGSTYTDTTVYLGAASRPAIATGGFSTLNPLDGYIDDLRVTRGFARYTANFTPPTAPFPDQ